MRYGQNKRHGSFFDKGTVISKDMGLFLLIRHGPNRRHGLILVHKSQVSLDFLGLFLKSMGLIKDMAQKIKTARV